MSTAVAKRVIYQLTPTELFIRAVDRAREVRDAGRARLDADYVERIETARNSYLQLRQAGEGPEPSEQTATDSAPNLA